ncbi:MAG: N-acetylneuraminic acid mutarotase [Flavobacteriales bacterium]|jgi:N-acetylneuraminic acid mutarotase
MKIVLVLITLIYGNLIFCQEAWIQMDSVNGAPKASCVGFSLMGEGYIGMGISSSGNKRSMYSYDLDQDDWDQELSLGGINASGLNRNSAVSFVIDNKAYVGTGNGSAPFLDDIWEYDPIAEVWTQKASFGGSPRRQAIGFAIDSLGYIGTGEDANGLTNDFWQYNPSNNSWVEVAEFIGTARKQAVGAVMGALGYVGTGNDGSYRRDFYEYNPNLDVWTLKPMFFGSPRYGATAFAMFPNLYIATGYDNTLSYKNDVWEYNFFTNTWTQKIDFPGDGRVNASSFVVDGIGFLGTGYNGTYLDDFYAYLVPLSNSSITNRPDEILVYPNPCINRFSVKLTQTTEAEIKLYSLNGAEHTCKMQFNQSENLVNVNVSNVSNGVYIYYIYQGKEVVDTGKIIVRK